MGYPSKHKVDDDALLAQVAEQTYGMSHGDKRHIIDHSSVGVSTRAYGDRIKVVAKCGQPLAFVHGVTHDWQNDTTNLDKKSTCARCLKLTGQPPEPKKIKCPTCNGTGKVIEQ